MRNRVGLFRSPAVKSMNRVRRSEGDLDGLRASRRNRLQHRSAAQLCLGLVVVPDQAAQRRRGSPGADHVDRLPRLSSTNPGPIRIDTARTAIVIVDMQNDFTQRTWSAEKHHDASLLTIQTLLGWVSTSADFMKALEVGAA